MKKKRSCVIFCISAILTISCGGGGGGSNVTGGVFQDDPVVGLTYTCGGQTGITGTGGTFSCPTGSTVTFSVGGITLCTMQAQPVMTPLSCVQANDPTANTATATVVAMARFLQSINTTPGTGVLTITASELQAAANLTLNFATATDGQLQAAVSAIDPGATLVSASAAQNALTTMINAAYAGTYSGTWQLVSPQNANGNWSFTTDSNGVIVSSSFAEIAFPNVVVFSGTISGSFVSGTTFNGTSSNGWTWTGSLDTSKTPAAFNACSALGQCNVISASAPGGLHVNGAFEGTKQ